MTLNLAQLLDILGHHADEHVSICHQPPGGRFTTAVHTVADAAAHVPTGADVWFGVNPIQGPPRASAGRGTADQVLRLAALYADLDIKPTGLADLPTATQVIQDLTEILGSRPSALTFSGHGLQPFWPLEDTVAGADARAMLRRFGRLVAAVAERRGGRVDSVYDLARVLRVPGTYNLKAEPLPVITVPNDGRPLTAEEVLDALDAYGALEQPGDRDTHTAVVSAPAEWEWADRTCFYVRAMIDGWPTNTPDARHPWLMSQATRLAAAHRNGCLAEADYLPAVQVLATRFRQLLHNPPARPENPGEISDALAWGRGHIATRNPAQVLAELGTHQHDNTELTLTGKPPATRPHTPPAAAPPAAPVLQVIQGGAGQQQPRSDGTAALAAAPEPARTLERSEDGHAQMLIGRYGHLIRFCPQRNRWLTWNGTRWVWQPARGGVVREYAKAVARDYPARDTASTNIKKRMLSSAGVTGALDMASTEPAVTVEYDHLDADPWTLNTPAGLVDLRTGQLGPSDPAALCTRITKASPDPNADPTRWLEFLADTFDDADLVGYLQRLVGYSAVGEVGPHVLPFCHGSGGNGKGVFLESTTKVLGDYATTAPLGFLMAKTYSSHETEIARLSGARMVICSEVNEGDRFDEAKVKLLAGGDTLTARFMKQDHFSFTPTHQLWLIGNSKPIVRSGGRAFWRRLRLIPFEREVPDEKIVDDLQGILANEHGSALMNWIIAGAVAYHQVGLNTPDSVKAATAGYAHDQDTVEQFLEDLCHLGDPETMSTPIAAVRRAYVQWCLNEGHEPVSGKALGTALQRRGIESRKGAKGVRRYAGLLLLATGDGPDDAPPAGDDTGAEPSFWDRVYP